MTSDQTPDPGKDSPEAVYKPGNPGGNWTPEEIDATSIKIFVPEYDETSTNYVNAATPLRYTIDPNAVLLVSPHWRTGWKV